MKILQVTYIFPPKLRVADGITNVVYNISKELVKRGHEVSVYTSNALDLVTGRKLKGIISFSVEGINVHYLNYLLKYNTFFLTPGLQKLLNSTIKNFDIVHIHDPRSYQGIFTTLNATKNRIPSIFQLHGSFLSIKPYSFRKRILRILMDRIISRRLVRNVPKIIALNQIEAEQYTKQLGIPEGRLVITPNGIDIKNYRNLPQKGHFKKMFNLVKDSRIILFVGRIHKIKGLDFLVKAYAYLNKTLKYTDATLVIAGPNDGYLYKLKKLITHLGISDKVLFTGPLFGIEKLKAYVDADVFVLPSRYETFPISLLEAYACSKPVICTNVFGMRDLVIDGMTGSLINFGDFKGLANSLQFLLTDSAEANEMGKRGREFVEMNFSIESVVDLLEEIFQKVISVHK